MRRSMGLWAACAVLVLALVPVSQPVYAWGWATHTYIVDHLGQKLEPFNLQEMYGAMLPDFTQADLAVNFDPLYDGYTHGSPGYERFMAIWNTARTPLARAIAFGYVSHNNVWGADSLAHDPLHGYVIEKAAMLDAGLDHAGIWQMVTAQTGMVLDPQDRLLFCHIIVEADGDIVLRQYDPRIGEKIITAALLRTPETPKLLVRAMAGTDPATVERLELKFRNYMLYYGSTLLQDEQQTIKLQAADVTRQVSEFLAFKGVPADQLAQMDPLLQQLSLMAMQQAMPLLGDYKFAVDQTVAHVRAELIAHGVKDTLF